MTSTRSGGSNQAQKLAAAASIPSLDMPALGREAGEPSLGGPTSGPTTRKRVLPAPEAALQPTSKTIRSAPLAIASHSRLPYECWIATDYLIFFADHPCMPQWPNPCSLVCTVSEAVFQPQQEELPPQPTTPPRLRRA
jgi:hypothetical protein